jgi:FAD:protein FMN transferase
VSQLLPPIQDSQRSPSAFPGFVRCVWRALGTRVELVVRGSTEQLAAAAAHLRDELDAVDRACSRFRSDAELVAVNAAAGSRIPVSSRLAEAVAVALRAAAQTDGDVDPTLGASLVAAGYDRDFAALPVDGPPISPSLPRTNAWREVELDVAGRTLRVPHGVALDLGATAKAWAADRATARIAATISAPVLVSLGGDLAIGGPPDDQPAHGWPVRLTDEAGDGDGPVAYIHDGGVASSSTVVRRWRRDGETLHHILDPRTGRPVDPVWRMVTVNAATCVDANTATTAAMVRGAAAPSWLAQLGLPSRLVDAHGAVSRIAGWPEDAVAS